MLNNLIFDQKEIIWFEELLLKEIQVTLPNEKSNKQKNLFLATV